MLRGQNTADWKLARSGEPEKLYGFHSGKIPFFKRSIARLFHGYVCRRVSGYCALCGTAPGLYPRYWLLRHGWYSASSRSPGNGIAPWRNVLLKNNPMMAAIITVTYMISFLI